MATPSAAPFALTGDPLIDAATHGYKWQLDSSRTINWALADGFLGEFWTSPATTANVINSVFSNISTYANVKFKYVGYYVDPAVAWGNGSDITISLDGSGILGTSTWAIGIFPNLAEGEGFAGDIFLNILSPANFLPSYAPGSAGYALAIHEIGHTLGLKHPHDSGGTGRPTLGELGLEFFNVDWFTVMSYNDDYDYNLRLWDPATPMVMDVLALQYLYGKNNSTNAGNTTYTFPVNGMYQTIWDAGGVDQVNVSSSSVAWVIQLPDFRLSELVSTKAGFAGPADDLSLPSPGTWYWLTGDIENAAGSKFADVLLGSALGNTLIGNGGNDLLKGFGGHDTLNGGSGNDEMLGGTGNDTYVVNSTGDVVTEAAVSGLDTVQSSISYTLGANLENLTLTGSANINGIGNNANNVIIGNGGVNTLNGAAGNDTMRGGAGNDVYVVNSSGDVVTEFANAGTDTVKSSISYTLGANIERLTLTGSGDINGTGNTLSNIITGNGGKNVLTGGGAADRLLGGSGNDTLVWDAADVLVDGGAGTDTLRLLGAGKVLDLTKIADNKILNMEAINISGSGNNTLKLSLSDVLAVSSTTDTLRIVGNAGDKLDLTQTWQEGVEVGGYVPYTRTSSGITATLLVDSDIAVV